MESNRPNLEILSFTIIYEDGLSYKVPVKDAESIDIIIAEDTVYQLTIHFQVNDTTLWDLKYTQFFKICGIVLKRRHVDVGEKFEPREKPYEVTLDKNITPKGAFYRRTFNCLSTYYANGKDVLHTPWRLTMTRK